MSKTDELRRASGQGVLERKLTDNCIFVSFRFSRILRKIASGDVKSEEEIGQLGDLSTLADPSLVPKIITIVHDVPDLKLKMSDHLA